MARIFFLVSILLQTTVFGQWEAPLDYYSSATGTGMTLKSQLEDVMTDVHIEARYGDFRFSAAIHDQDPNNPSNIRLVYDGQSVNANWDSGSTWNREHVWPQSRQPGSASNTTRGNLGDPHALRPSSPGVNSSRGNNPFGFADSAGAFGNNQGFWFTGNSCRGDIARSLFYSDTRWSSLGLSLVNGDPSGNQMGDLESLVAWHYLDPPDEFERRRNHTIYSSEYNPQNFTNNRNAFVDHPEFVWSIYVNQQNDSTISIEDGIVLDNGSSMLEVDFGNVEIGSAMDAEVSVVINKSGLNGTYYSISTVGGASTDLASRFNAFPMGSASSQTINVTLDYDPNVAGEYTGSVLINNLDITDQAGIAMGANDGDDLIDLVINVVEPFVLGDVNCDGTVNLLDVSPFVEAVAQGQFSEKADINGDGDVNLLDVQGFVSLLSS